MKKRYICKNCCYYIKENGDTEGYCCVEPLYTFVKETHTACKLYTSDMDDEDVDVEEEFIEEEEDDLIYMTKMSLLLHLFFSRLILYIFRSKGT